jgi:hypothetical protein
MNLTRKVKYFFQKLQELDTDKTSKKYKKEEAKIKEVSKELQSVRKIFLMEKLSKCDCFLKIESCKK